MKKVLALVLALVMAVSLASCGGNNNGGNNNIVGKWVSKINLKQTLDSVLDQATQSDSISWATKTLLEGSRGTYDDLYVNQIIEVVDNDNYKIYFEGVEDAEETLQKNVEEAVEKLYEENSTLSALSDVPGALEQGTKTVMTAFDLENRFNSSFNGKYALDGDKFYLDADKKDSYLVYSLSDDKLTISDIGGELGNEESVKEMLCNIFTKE